MAKQVINIGTTANDGTGDPLRTAFDKVNDNFTELYSDDLADVNSIVAGDAISVSGATGDVTVNVSGLTTSEIASATLVTETEGIGSNDNDTTLPTSAAVKDYVDTEISGISDNDTLGALTATDGGFVVGDGANFGVETGSTARDSIGLGTSGHVQFHCIGVGQAASTNSGQIDATTVYAGTFGKDSGDYISWTTDTQLDFYVNGANDMRLESDGDLHVEGDVIAASTTISSDAKLKENIEDISEPLSILKEIKGVDYNWKKSGEKASGVIAQDVAKVMPHAVKEVTSLDGTSTHLTVDYNAVIGLLVSAVNELQNRIVELEKK